MTIPALLLLIMLAAPTVTVILSLALRYPRLAEYSNLAAAIINFILSFPLLVLALRGPMVFAHGYVLLDLLGAWVILCVTIVYLLSSIYAIGYMRLLDEEERLPLFYALFSGFALTMLLACVMNSAGVYWIAIELTTLVSTFLGRIRTGCRRH